MYPRLRAMLTRSGFTVLDVQPAAITPRDRMLVPLAMLVLGATRLLPKADGLGMQVADGNHRAVLAGGAYIFIDAIKSAAA